MLFLTAKVDLKTQVHGDGSVLLYFEVQYSKRMAQELLSLSALDSRKILLLENILLGKVHMHLLLTLLCRVETNRYNSLIL